MKKKFLIAAVIFALFLLILPACDAREAGSVKALTRPYIAQYECTEATLGEENLLEKFDYITLVFEDKEKMQLIYKPKNADKQIIESSYTFDIQTRELTADIWILGYKFRQATTIEKGRFTISKPIGDRQLIMKFKSK